MIDDKTLSEVPRTPPTRRIVEKDLDSCRVALLNIMDGLPVEQQAKLVSEWLAGAFYWGDTASGTLYWAGVASALNKLQFKRNERDRIKLER